MRSPRVLALGLLVLSVPPACTSAPAGPVSDSVADSSSDSPDSPDSHDSPDSPVDTDTGETPGTGAQVVLFIGDGMGLEQVAGAGLFANGASGTLGLESLSSHGVLRTASLTGITDSAASGTAMATGVKTWNGHIGVDRDLTIVENLVERARARGMATGIVTTDRLSGATPSSFVVHTEDRYSYSEISAAYLQVLPDVSLGGGADDFVDLVDTAVIDVVGTGAELAAYLPTGRPLLGLFAPTTFPYLVNGYGEAPSLADMTLKAIELLKQDPNGFFLMVEGARIDHASHANNGTEVFPEVVAFDEAITAGIAQLSEDATVLVTADHECGGLHVIAGNGAGVTPTIEWRYYGHTNADVGVWGTGPYTDVVEGMRLDNAWVHSVLEAAVTESDIVAPVEVALVDGWLGELPEATVSQAWESSFGAEYNRLDALRVLGDADGLRIGIDGVFEDDANALFVYIDIDYGDGTGWPHDGALSDTVGLADSALSAAAISFADPAFGAERALVSLQAEEAFRGYDGGDAAGLRDLTTGTDLGWLESATNFDSGNVSLFDASAVDAGVVDEGFEAQIPWSSLYGTDTPAVERRLAVVAVLVSDTGAWTSNQALPSFPSSVAKETGPAELPAAVVFTVDADGTLVGAPVQVP